MTMMEKKLDAVIRYLLCETDAEQRMALMELRVLAAENTKSAICEDRELETLIRTALADLGIPDSLSGHSSLVCAISLAIREPETLERITKDLYPRVAEILGIARSTMAERRIRHAIETAWSRCDLEVLSRWFGNTVDPNKGRPTNGEFIARVANVLRNQI